MCNRVKLTSDANIFALYSPPGVTLSCKNCTVGGSVEISQGSFKLGDWTNGRNDRLARAELASEGLRP